MSRVASPWRQKADEWLSGAAGEVMRVSTAMGFFWVGDKNILESDSGDGGITL